VRKPGSKVWGVLYEVPDALISRDSAKTLHRKSFDQIEGEGSNYKREMIEVRRPNGEIVTALTYTVKSPQVNLKTNLAYVGHIVAGLREHGISEGYIAAVKAIAIANNPDIAAEVRAL